MATGSAATPSTAVTTPWYRRKVFLGGLLLVAVVVGVAVYFGVEYGPSSKSSSPSSESKEALNTKSEGLVPVTGSSSSSSSALGAKPPTVTVVTTGASTDSSSGGGGITNISAEEGAGDEPLDTTGQPVGLLGALIPSNNKAYAGANLWQAVSTQGGACYPANGAQLATMAASATTCPLIVLTRGAANPYTIRAPIFINTPKVIVGVNPIDRATLDGRRSERIFHGKKEKLATCT